MAKKNKRKNNHNKNRDLRLAQKGELYAFVRKKNGNTFTVELLSREIQVCSIERSALKQGWIEEGAVVLISSKSSKGGKYHIVHFYANKKHLDYLKKNKKLEFIENDIPQEDTISNNWSFAGQITKNKNDQIVQDLDDELEDLISGI
jgi:hypothetical protein